MDEVRGSATRANQPALPLAPAGEGERGLHSLCDREHGNDALPRLLVVDDQEISRGVVRAIFQNAYEILEAENGREALNILLAETRPVAVILLDLFMPVMDGMETLDALQRESSLQSIPVLIVSGANDEESSDQAIERGAVDFVAKPIDPSLLRLRVRNAIIRRETESLRSQNRDLLARQVIENRHQEQLRYIAEHDSVTHIYNKNAFYQKTRAILDERADAEYCVICFDVLRFRAVNDIFGHEEGDRLLRYIAAQLSRLIGEEGTCARVGVDLFAMCLPFDRAQLEHKTKLLNQAMREYDLRFEVKLCFGLYRVNDRSIPIHQMLDRAVIAERSVKGSYMRSYALYNDTMSLRLLEEQQVITDMAGALANHEFEAFYQPKCDLETGEIIGAEALVRWRHPVRGLLPPAMFVPIFEKNGFIMHLDEYMWEQVCAFLAKRLADDPADELRVSVNISRANLYNPNLCVGMKRLCDRYGVPYDRVEAEITESAYVDNAQLLQETTCQMRSMGFTVEMDDFGSGYSSLNMLKEIPVDILKLDMRFLYGIHNDQRGRSILSSVISMARKLEMGVIAEGVETREQAQLLLSLGCTQAQGYFFYQPMPADAFTRVLAQKGKTPFSV